MVDGISPENNVTTNWSHGVARAGNCIPLPEETLKQVIDYAIKYGSLEDQKKKAFAIVQSVLAKATIAEAHGEDALLTDAADQDDKLDCAHGFMGEGGLTDQAWRVYNAIKDELDRQEKPAHAKSRPAPASRR